MSRSEWWTCSLVIAVVTAVAMASAPQEPPMIVQPQPPPFATLPLHFPPHTGAYAVLSIRVTDGDTVRMWWLVEDVGRLAFINAPEISSPDGPASRDALAAMLTLDKPMRVVVHGREKFGRALVDIFDADGKSLSQRQVDGGFAKKWTGQGPKP